jgi:hypothetical protein
MKQQTTNVQQAFDVLLPVAQKDIVNLKLCIKKIIENINPRKIIVVANKIIKNKIQEDNTIEYCDEDTLYNSLTLDKTNEIIKYLTNDAMVHSGWYFQQFLKMAYAYKSNSEYYLIWDSDTIPLNRIQFFINKNKIDKCLFSMKDEYHIQYFKTIKVLFSGAVPKLTNESFISEHMMINKNIMLEMIDKIENNSNINGKFFYEKILYAIDREDLSNYGFSEFETYGNYVLKFHPDKYDTRELRTFRAGSTLINKNYVDENILNWVSKSCDTISFEDHRISKIIKILRDICTPIIKTKIIPFQLFMLISKMKRKICL